MMRLQEWRPEGARNFIRVGDIVKVLPAPDLKGTSFEAVVKAIEVDDATGEVRHVEVFGGKRGRLQFHAVRPDRIRRVAQTRGGERRERRR
jgi:hypothetical protein